MTTTQACTFGKEYGVELSCLVAESLWQSSERASWRCGRVVVLLWFAVVDTPPISSHDDMTVPEQMY